MAQQHFCYQCSQSFRSMQTRLLLNIALKLTGIREGERVVQHRVDRYPHVMPRMDLKQMSLHCKRPDTFNVHANHLSRELLLRLFSHEDLRPSTCYEFDMSSSARNINLFDRFAYFFSGNSLGVFSSSVTRELLHIGNMMRFKSV